MDTRKTSIVEAGMMQREKVGSVVHPLSETQYCSEARLVGVWGLEEVTGVGRGVMGMGVNGEGVERCRGGTGWLEGRWG